MSDYQISTQNDISKVTLVSVPDMPGIAARVFGSLWAHGFNVQLITSSSGSAGKVNLTFILSKKDLQPAMFELKKIREEIKADELAIDPEVALISIIHPQLSQTPGVAGKAFDVLAGCDINIQAVSTSMTCLNCLIAKNQLEQATRALQKEFKLI
ncbi:MAG: ACT domain-containing protein [candidate division Zixibacteria bacterium]|nr:ACT domain-containing protein [candidate division Zixibacteria bacterium]